MSTRALAALAVLRVNWDSKKQDYLDFFVPLVVEAIAKNPTEVVASADVQQLIARDFGLALPSAPLDLILKRCLRAGFLTKRDHLLYRVKEKCDSSLFRDVQSEVLTDYDEVVLALTEFARQHHNELWTPESAASALESFITSEGLDSLFLNKLAEPIAGKLASGGSFLVGLFIRHLRENNLATLDRLGRLVRGYMIANAIYLPDQGKVTKRFRSTRAFLDAPIVLQLLGFEGKSREVATRELLQLLTRYGAAVHVFQHSVEEVAGILTAVAHSLGERIDAPSPRLFPVAHHFLNAGLSSSDVLLERGKLETKIASLGVKISRKPEHEAEAQVDEAKLDLLLSQRINYGNPNARQRDVDSISAVARLSKGAIAYNIEDTSALFVTDNDSLVEVARDFFRPQTPDGAMSLCLSASSMACLLWLKDPTQAPDLPLRRLIADSVASLQPSAELWSKYIGVVQAQHESGTYSSDDYFILRFSSVAVAVLVERTKGEPAAVTQGTLAEVLEEAKARMKAGWIAERTEVQNSHQAIVETKDQQIVSLAGDLDSVKGQLDGIVSKLDRFARALSVTLAVIGFFLTLFALSLGLAITFPWRIAGLQGASDATLGQALIYLLFAFLVVNMGFGLTVRAIAAWSAKKIQPQISRFLRAVLGVKHSTKTGASLSSK